MEALSIFALEKLQLILGYCADTLGRLIFDNVHRTFPAYLLSRYTHIVLSLLMWVLVDSSSSTECELPDHR